MALSMSTMLNRPDARQFLADRGATFNQPAGTSLADKARAANGTAPAADYWSQFAPEGGGGYAPGQTNPHPPGSPEWTAWAQQATAQTRATPGSVGAVGSMVEPASAGSSMTPPPSNLPPGYETGNFTGGGVYPLASVMAPGLMQPWTTPFNRPELSEATDPGYAARMGLGMQAIERSNAARGTLRTGGNIKDLLEYGQTFGSNEYDKVYNRALGEYQMAQGIYNQNQANQFGRLNQISSLGQNAAAGVGNINLQQGNSQAAGTIGANNAMQEMYKPIANAGTIVADYLSGKRSGTAGVPAPLAGNPYGYEA